MYLPIASRRRIITKIRSSGGLWRANFHLHSQQIPRGKDVQNQWLDAREMIVTNDTYRDARVQWSETETISNV